MFKNVKISNVLIASGTLLILASVALLLYNLGIEKMAGAKSAIAISDLTNLTSPADNSIEFTDSMMPIVEIDGVSYIGKVYIPAIDITLPVINEWSKANAHIAPCRYKGSAYDDSLIIAGHNFNTHFGMLSSLEEGMAVSFTDVDGNEFNYEVSAIEIIDKYDVESMTSGDWDLTLFTCTPGGKQRVTVRCQRE